MKKRIISTLLILMFCLIYVIPVNAADEDTIAQDMNELEQYVKNSIIDNLKEDTTISGILDLNNAKIVEVNSADKNTLSLNTKEVTLDTEKILEVTTYDEINNTFVNHYITPLTIDTETNELVNTFAYATSLYEQSIPNSDGFTRIEDVTTDCYFYARVYYTRYSGVHSITYRMYNGYAYWSGNNSSITGYQLRCEFVLTGQLYKYPECTTGGSECMLQNYYTYALTVDEASAAKDQLFYASGTPIPTNRAIRCPSPASGDGLNIWMSFTYSLNGQRKTWQMNYKIGEVVS